jgi:hypothetical protein
VAVGLAVGLAVAVAVAVALAVGLAAIIPPMCCLAKAAGESSSTSTALTVNRNKILFMKHPLHDSGALQDKHPPFPSGYCGRVVRLVSTHPCLSLFTQVPGSQILGSSLSSGAARMRSRVRHEAPEDGI